MLTGLPRRQRGISLVELMIGLTIGMIIVAGVTTMYISSLRGGTDTLRSSKLNQALRASMDLMVSDIRRAGFWGIASTGQNPFTIRGGGSQTDLAIHTLNSTGDCLLFAYDATHQTGNTPGLGSADFFGFRLADGELVVRQGNSDGNFTADCTGADGWEALTDSRDVVVDSLAFSLSGSRCLNTNTGVNWTSASATVPACDDAAAAGYTAPASGARLIEVRYVRITLAGHLTSDPTMRISLSEAVRVRNDRIIPVP